MVLVYPCLSDSVVDFECNVCEANELEPYCEPFERGAGAASSEWKSAIGSECVQSD